MFVIACSIAILLELKYCQYLKQLKLLFVTLIVIYFILFKLLYFSYSKLPVPILNKPSQNKTLFDIGLT